MNRIPFQTQFLLTFSHFKSKLKTYVTDYFQCFGIFNDFALYLFFMQPF